jgi:hypothetical protein
MLEGSSGFSHEPKFGGRSAPTPENLGGRVVSVWSRD